MISLLTPKKNQSYWGDESSRGTVCDKGTETDDSIMDSFPEIIIRYPHL